MSGSSIELWMEDLDAVPDRPGVLLWQGRPPRGAYRSLLCRVDERAEVFRSRYLEWIEGVGRCRVDDRTLVQQLTVDEGPSHWWMTQVVEANPYKGTAGADSLRLLALEDLLLERAVGELLVVGGGRSEVAAIRGLCIEKGVRFRHRSAGRRRWRLEPRRLVRHVGALSALGAILRRLWRTRGIIRSGPGARRPVERSVLLCAQTFDLEDLGGGRRRSSIWRGFEDVVANAGLVASTLHVFVPTASCPDSASALSMVQGNRGGESTGGAEGFVESHLDGSAVLAVLRRWWRVARAAPGERRLVEAIDAGVGRGWLWPLHREAWRGSTRGPESAHAALAVVLFDRALGDLPPQEVGVYAFENHAWERAFVHAWYRHGHGVLVAYPHATVRFWDLRYHSSVRPVDGPGPDLVAVSGDGVRRSADWAAEGPECEALRYQHLDGVRRKGPPAPAANGAMRILVLEDYSDRGTAVLGELLAGAVSLLDRPAELLVRSHQGVIVGHRASTSIASGPLEDLMDRVDVAVSANRTSASVDMYLLGVPVVVVLDDDDLDLSPLRGTDGVRFASGARELAEALTEATSTAPPDPGQFLYLGDPPVRWNALMTMVATEGRSTITHRPSP